MSPAADPRDAPETPEPAPDETPPTEDASPPVDASPPDGTEPAKDTGAPKGTAARSEETRRAAAPAGSARPPGSPLAELARGAAWLVGVAALAQTAALFFQSSPLAVAVVGAVITDLALGRAGVRWDPAAGENTVSDYRLAARRMAVGAGIALAVTAAVTGIGLVAGWAKVSVHASATSLVLGLVRALATAVRDGLLYAGLPLYFVGRARGTPPVIGVVFGALAAGAALVLQPAAAPANVVLAVSVAAAAAVFWLRDGAGWAAAGVHGGFALTAGVLFRGGLLDVTWTAGRFSQGFGAEGAPAWIGAAAFGMIAAAQLSRSQRAPRPERALP